ncbi:AbrB/MazE/SpoVT family DNA-binding domain-containing protein [Thermofilum sp.]|jgi:bifunctional DNA-binding transcriptional regulator/antitoxin component of YhaV-PrlF toxin-antitoxin module|uniref:AbrB/MazE/SpoVT family DNA-binding domain-containing protein n=1 Tax=Thermofilum sp. TaxID=1961369 RepID=UPI00258C2098|nr:AbrB/MazE/SpoVT family DNA-binding domain-containing protein [Thermofilum sp.]
MEYIRVLDRKGRLLLPKEWREKYARYRLVRVRIEGERIIIEPVKPEDFSSETDFMEPLFKSDGRGETRPRLVRGDF